MSKTIRQFLSLIVIMSATFALSLQATGAPSGKSLHRRTDHTAKHRVQKQDIGKKKSVQLYGNHLCPVSLDSVDPRSFVEYRDKEANVSGRIYLCCDACKERAEENLADLYRKVYRTEKKTRKAKDAWDVRNSRCPVKGVPALADVTSEYNGMLVHFHAPECVDDFLKKPESGMFKILPKDKRFAFVIPPRLRMAHRQ